MKRDEFIFTIGYQGQVALVDGHSLKAYKNLSTLELSEKGLFKEAFCAALYDDNQEEMEQVLAAYNRKSGSNYSSIENLKRLFGVFDVPEKVDKVKIIR